MSTTATTTTTTLEVNYDYQSAQRFPAWMALAVFSAICLAAFNSQDDPADTRTSGEKWVLSVTAISMSFAFLSCLAYLFVRGIYVGTIFEVGMTALLLAFWGAGLPVIMNPANAIAVEPTNDGTAVKNANLYFFSWLALGANVFIAGSLAQETSGVEIRQVAPAKNARWYGMSATSIVVMAASVRIYNAYNEVGCGDASVTKTEYCKRTKFSISVGTISAAACLVTSYLLLKGLNLLYEFMITTGLLVLWCFGVGFITFGYAPGMNIGNLYFAAWISFILIVFMFGQTFRDYTAARAQGAAAATGGSSEQAGANGDGAGGAAYPAVDNHMSPEIPAEEDI